MFRTLALSALVATSCFAANIVDEVSHPLSKAFAPSGFTTIDPVRLVVKGTFEKPCFQLGDVAHTVDASKHRIELELKGFNHDQRCTRMGESFTTSVKLSPIAQAGTYDIVDKSTGKGIGTLVVDQAVEGKGPALYASLTDAFLVNENGNTLLVIRGSNVTKCVFFGEVKFKADKDVLIAYPMVDSAPTPSSCFSPAGFERKVPVNVALPATPFLLHVKVMGGQSIDKLVQ